MRAPGTNQPRAGFTLVEVSVALTIAALVLGSMAVSMHREAKGLSEMAGRTAQERSANEMLGRLESELEFATGATPQAFLSENLTAGLTSETAVDSSLGFPAFGTLLLEPGTGSEERITYQDLDPTTHAFRGLTRGVQCGEPAFHLKNTLVRWAAIATPITDQVNPLPEDHDGLALLANGTVFFRGDGTGFSYRVPTDPSGAGDYYQDGAVQWGATLEGAATLQGWSALYFQPVGELREDEFGIDVDRDGDTEDLFDLGRIRMLSWNAFATDPRRTDVALCPPIVLQKRCDWGGDLDGDGFDDPLFLWEPVTGRLHIRMFLVAGQVANRVVPRRLQTTLYLRNGAWE